MGRNRKPDSDLVQKYRCILPDRTGKVRMDICERCRLQRFIDQ